MRLLLIVVAAAQLSAPAWAGSVSVAAANPHASQAGMAVLRQGGSVADAAIAVQTVLGLVEPQSSGLGGGLFALLWDGAHLSSLDGRERAPATLPPTIFMNGDEPLGFIEAALSGRSVGAPGVVAALAALHERHGALAWARSFAPAIALAENGFALSARLYTLLGRDPYLARDKTARALYYQPNGEGGWEPKPIGTLVRNPAYAATLRLIAEKGAAGFYEGELARTMSQTAQAHGGHLSEADLRAYEVRWRAPLCADYRGYVVCSMGPPSSGAVALLQILGILSHFDMAALAPSSSQAMSPQSVHFFAEASRLAFADRARYLGDADFVSVPLTGLLRRDYLQNRAALIDPAAATPAAPGRPWRAPVMLGEGSNASQPSTSHFSILDARGHWLSVTTSIEAAFGSHLMAGGFLLNNQLTDFSFRTKADGLPIANAPAPRKRPRSSMTPTIIFAPDGSVFASLGSPGGPRIISFVARSVVALIDWQMSLEDAFALPHIHATKLLELEAGKIAEDLVPPLEAMGHRVLLRQFYSGLHGIRQGADGLSAAADKRREGQALIAHEPPAPEPR